MLVISNPFDMAAQKKADKESRRQWDKEIRDAKKRYIVKELDLNTEQTAKFFPLYFAMEDELQSLQRQTKQMEKELNDKGDKATPLETEKTIEAIYEQKSREGAIEMKYLPKFKEVLSVKQLVKLKKAERKFFRELMKHRKD